MRLGCTRFTVLAAAMLAAGMSSGCGSPDLAANGGAIRPDVAEVDPGEAISFATAVDRGETVDWSVMEPDGGDIAPDGTYTAPQTEGEYHVVATFATDSLRSSATVRVRKRARVVVSPSSAALATGASLQLSASVAGTLGAQVDWSVTEGDAGGTVTPDGVYTAPQVPGTFHVVAASAQYPTRADTATITVTGPAPLPPPAPAVAVAMTPSTATVVASGTVQFSAAVTGSADTAVTWSVAEGTSGGSISPAGLYTAPASAGTYRIVATSHADPSRTATATVTVTAPPPPVVVGISVAPATVSLTAGNTAQLSATVTGSSDVAVAWSVREGSAGGTITSAGLYTAPATAGTYHVVATSHADSTKTASATVTVTAPANPASVDVKSYGAVGDGLTDDTAAFIRAANSMKPLVISKPPAHYRLTGKVRVYASVTGDGSMPEIRMYGATGQETHAMLEVRDYLGTGLVISGLHLNGQWDGVGSAGEWSHNIMIKGSKNVTVENNVLERPYGDCILVGGEGDPNPSESVVIRNNTMSGPRRCDVALISVRNLTIDRNVIRKSNGYVSAIDLEPNPNGVDSDWGVTISNNQFDVLGTAVLLYHATTGIPSGGIGGNVTITGNTGNAGVFYSKTGAWTNVVLSSNTVN